MNSERTKDTKIPNKRTNKRFCPCQSSRTRSHHNTHTHTVHSPAAPETPADSRRAPTRVQSSNERDVACATRDQRVRITHHATSRTHVSYSSIHCHSLPSSNLFARVWEFTAECSADSLSHEQSPCSLKTELQTTQSGKLHHGSSVVGNSSEVPRVRIARN